MPSPQTVIGVDLGMTYTGVAISYGPGIPIKLLNEDWPGAEGQIHYKVPTLLVYSQVAQKKPRSMSRVAQSHSLSRAGSRKSWIPTSWGFLALDGDERVSPDKLTREFFKLFIDKNYFQKAKISTSEAFDFSYEDVCNWCRDFLNKLYNHIKEYFIHRKPHLWNDKVRFVFSVPTTWEDAEVVDRFKTILREAGFGEEPNHTADVSLTEAQAAAVATATDETSENGGVLKQGQNILVCDAGGGTTDIALLQVESAQGESLRLRSIDSVKGRSTGSTKIDRDFRNLVEEKLKTLNDEETAKGKEPIVPDIGEAARLMAADKTFERHKCNLGPESLETDISFPIKVPGLPSNLGYKHLGIEAGKLQFSPSQMASLFDPHVQTIYGALDEQLKRMISMENERDRTLHYMILSGGLGSSKYLYHQLKQRYGGKNLYGRQLTKNTVILRAENPQTVVCRGLVIDEISKANKKGKALNSWISSRSYGVIGIKEFDPNQHLQQDKMRDDEHRRQTGKTYAENQITWVVNKGQRLDTKSDKWFNVVRRFQQDSGDSMAEWTSRMVVSDRDLEDRPNTMSKPGCETFCVLKSDFSNIDPEKFDVEKRSSWRLQKGKTHLVARYKIKVIVGPADVKFELWFNNKKMSAEADINVDYDSTVDEILQPLNRLPALLRRGTSSLRS